MPSRVTRTAKRKYPTNKLSVTVISAKACHPLWTYSGFIFISPNPKVTIVDRAKQKQRSNSIVNVERGTAFGMAIPFRTLCASEPVKAYKIQKNKVAQKKDFRTLDVELP